MSVNVREGHRKQKGKWLVDIFIRFAETDEVRRKKYIVGAGTPYAAETRTKHDARVWGEAREHELRKEGPPSKQVVVEPEKKNKVPTVEVFGPEWIEKHAKASLHKASGIDSQESILRLHLYPFVGGFRLDELTDEAVADLKSKWIKGGHKYTDQYGRERVVKGTSEPKTINNRLTVLSSMLEMAYEWKRIAAIPCRIKMLPVDAHAEADHYDHETYERLVEASERLDPRIRAAILLGGDGGLRRGEIISLNLSDIDFKNGRFLVKRNVFWKKGQAIVDVPKGRKAKPVPTTPRLLAALKACRHLRGERLLLDDDGQPVTPKVIKRWIMRAERLAGLPPTGRLHVMRHTFASHLAMAGVPARTIQELARHASLSITMRYMHLSPNATEEGIAMLTKSRAAGGGVTHGPRMAPEEAKSR